MPDLYPVRTGIRVASLKYDKTQPPQTNGCYPRSASSAHVPVLGLTTAKSIVKEARQEASHMATLNDINKTL